MKFPDEGIVATGSSERTVHASQSLMPSFSFKTYPDRRQISVTISGFWTESTFAQFANGLRNAVAALGCAPGEHLLCCDVSKAAIQPQDIVKAFQHLILNGPTHARKLALWTSNPLSRMQSRRIVGIRDNIAVFEKEIDAVRWLAG